MKFLSFLQTLKYFKFFSKNGYIFRNLFFVDFEKQKKAARFFASHCLKNIFCFFLLMSSVKMQFLRGKKRAFLSLKIAWFWASNHNILWFNPHFLPLYHNTSSLSPIPHAYYDKTGPPHALCRTYTLFRIKF